MNKEQASLILKDCYVDNHHSCELRKLTEEQKEEWTNYLRYFPAGYSEELQKFIEDEMCMRQTMIFVPDRADKNTGFCTHCKKVVDTSAYKHKMETNCPHCHYPAEVVHAWRRRDIVHKGYFEYYEKTETDDKAFICRGIFYRRTIDAINRKVNFDFEPHAFYLFRAEGMERREVYFGNWTTILRKVKVIGSRFSKYQNINDCQLGADKKSLLKAIKGTPWQWCCIDKLIEMGLPAVAWLKYLAKYKRQPKMELLIKLGLGRVLTDLFKYEGTYYGYTCRRSVGDVICWQAKKPTKVLKMELTKQDRKFIKANEDEIDESVVMLFQLIKAENQKANIEAFGWSFKDIKAIAGIAHKLNKVLSYTGFSLTKIRNYITKQLEVEKENSLKLNKPWSYIESPVSWLIGDYCDYLEQVRYFNLDMADTAVSTPHNMLKAHTALTEQRTALEEERRRLEMQKRAEKMAKEAEEEEKTFQKLVKFRKSFAYTSGDLFCRAAASAEELVNEGMALSHCVGQYAKRYYKGETNIVFIRKKEEPDKPYYTVEVANDGHIAQVRGYKNCAPTDDVKQFMAEYTPYIGSVLSSLKRVA